MKKRIWELDAFRGICLLGMVIVHLVYDLVYLYGILDWQYPTWFTLVQQWGGIFFILLSGTCVTLGTHHVKRGLIVIGCGMLVSVATWGMYLVGFADKGIIIYFGVLHCLGVCMLLWSVFRRLPNAALIVIGALLAAAGMYLLLCDIRPVSYPYLAPLGILNADFSSSDYFPLLPHLGFFLLGAVLGRTAYRRRETLLPRVNESNPVLRFLCLCGRQSLWIYLGHQPVLAGLCMLISYLQ